MFCLRAEKKEYPRKAFLQMAEGPAVDFLRPFLERKDDLICMKTGKYKQVSS